MVREKSYMFLTGPKVVKSVTHEVISEEDLGGAEVHTTKSGVAHYAADTEAAAMDFIKELLGFIPSNNMERAPILAPGPSGDGQKLNNIIPNSALASYDMKEVILETTDNGKFLEIHPNFAANIIVGFARYAGVSVGIVANRPSSLAGVLDSNASVKAARFIRFCDCFNIPIVSFVDVPGFLPGSAQEYMGIIRHGAKLMYAYAEATVPKITIITRKNYGGAYCVMSSKHLRGDLNYAWPTAEMAVMGEKGAVEILYARESDEVKRAKEIEYKEAFLNPYIAAERGHIDDIILPSDTRKKIITGLELLRNKRAFNPDKKHGNIPL
jgi:propionyl-CoA carboxylase beta chain